MKVGELIDYHMLFNNDEEIAIDIYETVTNKYIDTTADIAIDEDGVGPTFKINVEAEKVNDAVSGNLT